MISTAKLRFSMNIIYLLRRIKESNITPVVKNLAYLAGQR